MYILADNRKYFTLFERHHFAGSSFKAAVGWRQKMAISMKSSTVPKLNPNRQIRPSVRQL